jgi:multimeric flavodoxin WrbA
MKILALNGSHRGDRGAIGKLLQSMGAGVEKAGGIWNVVHLSQLNVETCLACNHCQRKMAYKCIFDGMDDTEEVFNKMKDADILIYASPVYVFGVSSLLKRFIERMHSRAPVGKILLTKSGLFFHDTDRSISGKPFVSIVVCDNLENLTVRNTREYFRILGRFMDASHLAHLERRTAAAWMAALEATEHQKKEKAKNVLAAYVRAGEELVLKGHILRKTKKIAQQPFIRIPFLIRAARHISLFRPFVEKEISRRADNISNMIGVKVAGDEHL